MCVIIYIPENSTISKDELKDAWNTNPHGAGYSIQEYDKVFYKRGFMDFNSYYNEIKDLIGNYNLLLHLRISTSKKVNKIQTHPYEKGNVTVTQGYTKRPVICMNGIISGQTEYLDCNDTMSYIIDHQSAFANVNQDILNIIEKATGAKWAVMKPDEVLLSSKFQEKDGKFYSNKNHLFKTWTWSGSRKKQKTIDDLIKNKTLRKGIKKDYNLCLDVEDFIDYWCNCDWYNMCNECTKCLKTANTLRDVKTILNENYFYEEEYDLDEETEYNELCYDGDIYDYGESCEIDYDTCSCSLDKYFW